MNKIEIVNDKIIAKQLDDNITVSSALNNINLRQIKIKITNSSYYSLNMFLICSMILILETS